MSAALLVPSELVDIETLDNFKLQYTVYTIHMLIYSLIVSLDKENIKTVLVHILQ